MVYLSTNTKKGSLGYEHFYILSFLFKTPQKKFKACKIDLGLKFVNKNMYLKQHESETVQAASCVVITLNFFFNIFQSRC